MVVFLCSRLGSSCFDVQIACVKWRIVTFFIIVPYKYCYLLTYYHTCDGTSSTTDTLAGYCDISDWELVEHGTL